MKIICLEGCSGTGKTTQYHLLNSYYTQTRLKHLAVVEKHYEPFKSIVKEWHETKGPTIPFTEDDIKRFAEARAETFSKNFSHLDNKVDFILMDRYFYTSAVYQRGYGMNPKDILQINIEYGAPTPDLTFLFDCEPEICFERANKRNQLNGGKHLFSTSPEKILKIKEQYIQLVNGRKEVMIIDTSRYISEITPILISKINYLVLFDLNI